MTFDEYVEKQNNRKNTQITNTTTKTQNTSDIENVTSKDNNLVYLTINSETYWFTKQELMLTGIVLTLSIVLIILLTKRYVLKHNSHHSNTKHKSVKILLIILFVVLAILLLIYFPNIFIDLVITAIAYEVVPIFLRFILKRQYNKSEAKKIAIFNAILVFILFKIFQLIILGTFGNSYECFLWGYVSFKLLYTDKDKNIEKEG